MRIVTRQGWGARAPKPLTFRPTSEVVGVCYHHTAGPQPSLRITGPMIVRGIQTYEMDHANYSDIAYNALIGPRGKIYEGRTIDAMGAHSNGKKIPGLSPNRNLLGIAFIGNYMTDQLTSKQIESALFLEYVWGLKIGKPLKVVMSHRDNDLTLCPGTNVYSWVEKRLVLP